MYNKTKSEILSKKKTQNVIKVTQTAIFIALIGIYIKRKCKLSHASGESHHKGFLIVLSILTAVF